MTRRLHTLLLTAALTLSVPTVVTASSYALYGIEELDERVTVSVEQQTVIVNGAQGETLEVVSLTGKRMLTVKIDSPAQRVELNIPKGCYILKVGNVVRKITVK